VARASLGELMLNEDRRECPLVVTQTWQALGRWRRRKPPDLHMRIDSNLDLRWEPCHYWVLRLAFRDIGGATAYQESHHWQLKASAQKRQVSTCERCGSTERLHAHHLHYETVGTERVGIDLLTLCETCHLEREHGHYSPQDPDQPDDGVPF
jgi:hypothetical protein